jgi:hypothetical protein
MNGMNFSGGGVNPFSLSRRGAPCAFRRHAPTKRKKGACADAQKSTTFAYTVPHMQHDLTLTMRISPGDTYEWSRVLLARARFDGTLELLTAAWERLLGYGRYELRGKTLRQMLGTDERTATAVAAILDERSARPVDVLLRCRDGDEKAMRLHRRYDSYEHAMFIVAEESNVHGLARSEPGK